MISDLWSQCISHVECKKQHLAVGLRLQVQQPPISACPCLLLLAAMNWPPNTPDEPVLHQEALCWMCLLSTTPDQQGYLKSMSPDAALTSSGAQAGSNSDQTGMTPILFLRRRPGSLTTKNHWRRRYLPNTLRHHAKLLTFSTPPQHGAMGVSVQGEGVFSSPHFAHLSPLVQSVSRWRVAFRCYISPFSFFPF